MFDHLEQDLEDLEDLVSLSCQLSHCVLTPLSRELTSNDPRNFDAGSHWQPAFWLPPEDDFIADSWKGSFHRWKGWRSAISPPDNAREAKSFSDPILCAQPAAKGLQAQAHQRWFWTSKRNQKNITACHSCKIKFQELEMLDKQLWDQDLDHFVYRTTTGLSFRETNGFFKRSRSFRIVSPCF